MGRSSEIEKEKKEPSPPKRVSSRLSVKDLSAETKSRLGSTYVSTTPKKCEEKGPPITFNTRYKQAPTTRGRSRDPSPAATTKTTENTTGQTALQRISAARSRDPSPSTGISAFSRLSAARSRDTSPVSKSYTDSDKSHLSRTYSNKSSDSLSSKTLGRSLSNTLSSARDKLEKSYSLTTTREKSRDPSPSARISSIASTFSRSRDPSPSNDKYLLSSYRLTNGREKSREPSPSIALNKSKLRESSPLNISNYRRPSREPSPTESLSKFDRSTASSGFSSSYNKIFTTTPSSSVKSPEMALSYMTASECSVANAARATRISFINRHSPKREPEVIEPPKPTISITNNEDKNIKHSSKVEIEAESSETSSSSEEESSDESSEEQVEEKKPEPKIMIQVSTITRATSPNPTSSTSSSRSSRRIEVAKTIERVRERPLISPAMVDKATQSDRMDDSTRFSRYGSQVRSPYTPYSSSPTSYSSRYTSGPTTTPRYSREPSELSNAETEKSESSQKSDKINFALPKSKEGSPIKSDTSRASSIKSPSPSKICISKDRIKISPPSESKIKSKTPLPPQSPSKAESPTKIASPKLNKDFRKSALNMGGESDNQRRSKSSSSENSSPTVEKTRQQFQQMLNDGEQQQQQVLQSHPPVERSSSLESEEEEEESTESIEMESQIQQPELTKEEKIVVKVEEAKSFLLKTLGNPTFSVRESPTSEISEVFCDESSSVVPQITENESCVSTVMGTTEKTTEEATPWWAVDEDVSVDNDITTGDDSTLQLDNNNNDTTANQLVNGFSDINLNSTQDSSKWSWNCKETQSLKMIQRVESGEKAWWCTSPENKMTASENQAIAEKNDLLNVNNNLWEQETQADISELQKDDEINEIEKNFQSTSSDRHTLGDRASPEGLESHDNERKSPYDNLASSSNVYGKETIDFNARPRLFISRHTNIDDLLGEFKAFNIHMYLCV